MTSADTLASARTLLRDAIAYLDASGIPVELHPHEGCWRYVVGGKLATEGGIIAMASLMQPGGSERMQ